MSRELVVVLVRDGVLAVELGMVHRVFNEARDEHGHPFYEVATCALAPGQVRTDGDFRLAVQHGPELLAQASTVVVAATDHDATGVDATEQDAVSRALSSLGAGTRVASVCTATFLLAAAGLLDGRECTTHWSRAELFRRRFPGIQLRPEMLYTDDGDVLTSAGVASVTDMCVHMVATDHGTAIAGAVARRLVMAPYRAAGDAQYLARPVAKARVAGTARARGWALENLGRVISLHDLARQEEISTRTLTRRFREETGTSPTQWLLARRLERARELLESTELGVDVVARRCGFGSTAAMRLHMRSALHVSPSTYRRSMG